MNEKLEIWLPVVGYEGIYEISSLGRLKTLSRKINTYFGGRTTKERIRKMNTWGEEGYVIYTLSKDGINTSFSAHRLVAEHYIPNPDNKPEVNHKDGNKSNPAKYNLEWVTSSENKQHSHDTGLQIIPKGDKHHLYGKRGFDSHKGKIVLDTQTGIFYGSAKEAANVKSISRAALTRRLTNKVYNNTGLIYV